jgi:hypothetical protein
MLGCFNYPLQDLQSRTGEFQDMEPGVGPVNDIDEPALINLNVVGLDDVSGVVAGM